MVPPQRCESEQYEEKEIKSRESTRSKSHEFMCSDWMTLRGDTLGQVKSKSFPVLFQYRTTVVLRAPQFNSGPALQPLRHSRSPLRSPRLSTQSWCAFSSGCYSPKARHLVISLPRR